MHWGTFESRAQRRLLRARRPRPVPRAARPSDDFREGLWHSVQFVLYTVPAGLVLGVLLAVAAHRRLQGHQGLPGHLRSTLASSVAVTSVIFFYLFNPAVGLFPGQLAEQPRHGDVRGGAARRSGRTWACRS